MKEHKIRLVMRLKDCNPPIEVIPSTLEREYRRDAGDGDYVNLREGYSLEDVSVLKNDPNRVRKHRLDRSFYSIVEEAGEKLVIFPSIPKRDAEKIVLNSLRYFVGGEWKIDHLELSKW